MKSIFASVLFVFLAFSSATTGVAALPVSEPDSASPLARDSSSGDASASDPTSAFSALRTISFSFAVLAGGGVVPSDIQALADKYGGTIGTVPPQLGEISINFPTKHEKGTFALFTLYCKTKGKKC
ncbi:hypothetical protein FIBSPDRAFT_886533 [Athelia psychrophila]|uniref:Uncharacterized protein n=1 Tax=Athelia psychrophila TaxID=1759441 RepID=A0A166QKW5_9AGAM|nr:hypothetical protein FIBSPDRAFT_952648 [Fibularhizoctonia sp. CBS 109695]KZP27273.1 hypothetical protein FIBSPDRAFT_886533 [Fibularhizoctonia sp. CBS 109695]